MKNWWKTSAFKEKLDVISQLQNCEQTVDTCCDIRLARSSVRTIRDNAEWIRWTATLRTKVGTARICYSRRHTIEHMEKDSEYIAWKSKSAPCACKFLLQVKALYIYENSSKDKDDDSAKPFSSSTGWFSKFTKTIVITLKLLGKLLLLTLWQLKSFLLY
jgi:hypothetical protein